MSDRGVTRRKFIKACGLAALGAFVVGCSDKGDSEGLEGGVDSFSSALDSQTLAEKTLGAMTLEQKLAQLFIVTPESLTGYDVVTEAGDVTAAALSHYPVGGLCYFSQNIEGKEQLEGLLADTARLCGQSGAGVAPFLCVDEEGGSLVARVANSGYFDVERFPDMADVGAAGDVSQAAYVGKTIGGYLQGIGFNLDFAPVADVLTNADNQVIGSRSFGSDPDLVSSMSVAEAEALGGAGVLPCAKHFPGHGDTAGDSHTGQAVSYRSRGEIESCELVPFQALADAQCPLIMVGHIQTPNFAADGLPASLSETMITEVLRGEIGFNGVVVSDSFSMGAITQYFGPDEAARRFILAGGDAILMPQDLSEAYQGLEDAVSSGDIPESRIDESVLRILQCKEAAGVLI